MTNSSPHGPRKRPLNHSPEAVTYAREQAGLTKRALAQRIGISEQLMGEIESGRRNATPERIKQLAEALSCPRVALEAKRGAALTEADAIAPEAVTYAREQAGLTKQALAERIGIGEQVLDEIESGHRNAAPTNVTQLAQALNCPRAVLEAQPQELEEAAASRS
ncbi:helix-turn-helix transcriptional regulator [Streptomyces sp. NPDC006207]